MKPVVARQGIVSLKIKDAAELYSAYMPFLKRGGLFAPTASGMRWVMRSCSW